MWFRSRLSLLVRSFALCGFAIILSVGFWLPVHGAFGSDWVRERKMWKNTCKCSFEHLDFLVVCETKKQQKCQQQSVKAVQLNDSFYIHNNIFMFGVHFSFVLHSNGLPRTLPLSRIAQKYYERDDHTGEFWIREKKMRGRSRSVWHLHAAKQRVYLVCTLKKNRRAAHRFFSNRTKIFIGCLSLHFIRLRYLFFLSTCFLCHSLISLYRCHSLPFTFLSVCTLHSSYFTIYEFLFSLSLSLWLKCTIFGVVVLEQIVDAKREIQKRSIPIGLKFRRSKRCHVQIIDKILRENIGISHMQSVKFTTFLFQIFHMCVRVCSVG